MKKITNIFLSFLLVLTSITWPIVADDNLESECKPIPKSWFSETSQIKIKEGENEQIINAHTTGDIELDIDKQYAVLANFDFFIPESEFSDVKGEQYCFQIPSLIHVKANNVAFGDKYGEIGKWSLEDGVITIDFNADYDGHPDAFGFDFKGEINIEKIIEEKEIEVENPFKESYENTITIIGKGKELEDSDHKKGTAYKAEQPTNEESDHILWTSEINTATKAYENLVIKDALSGPQSYGDLDQFKLVKITKDLKGKEIAREEIAIDETMIKFNENRTEFSLKLGKTDATYELSYPTKIEKQNPGSEPSQLSNSISRLENGTVEKTVKDDVEVTWREAKDSLTKKGEKITENRIKWIIDYNLEKNDLGTKINIEDTMSHGKIDINSVKIYKLEVDNNAEVKTETLLENTNDFYKLSEDEKTLAFDFVGEANTAYRFVYESDVPFSNEAVTVSNKVIDKNQEGKEVEGEVTVKPSPSNSKKGTVKIDKNGKQYIEWEIIVNSNGLNIGQFTIQDRFDTSIHTFVEDSIKIKPEVKSESQKVEHGFNLTVTPNEIPSNETFIITYKTYITDKGLQNDNIKNEATVIFNSIGAGSGIDESFESEGVDVSVIPKVPQLSKKGNFVYVEKDNKTYSLLKWEVDFNTESLTIDNFKLTDEFSDGLSLVMSGDFENIPGLKVFQDGKDVTEAFTVGKIENIENGFSLTYKENEGTLPNKPYKLVYYTVFDEENKTVTNPTSFKNEATISWKGKEGKTAKEVTRTPGVNKKVEATNPNATENQTLKWTINFNENRQVFYDFVLTDTLNNGESSVTIKQNSIQLYEVEKDGVEKPVENLEEKGFQLKVNEDKKGFKLENKKLKPKHYRIVYETSYSPENETIDQKNKVVVEYKGGKEKPITATFKKATLKVKKEGVIDKENRTVRGNAKIDWTVTGNQGYVNMVNPVFKDSFKPSEDEIYDHAVLIHDGENFDLNVKQFSPDGNLVKPVNLSVSLAELKANETVSVAQDGYTLILQTAMVAYLNEAVPAIVGFDLKVPDGRYQYEFSYSTEILTYPSVNQAGYLNTVKLASKYHEDVKDDYYVSYYEGRGQSHNLQKEGIQNIDTDLIDWTVVVNKDRNKMRDAFIVDEVSGVHNFGNEEIQKMLTIKLIPENVNDASDYLLLSSEFYSVTFDGLNKMMITFNDFNLEGYQEYKGQINHAYQITYHTDINDDFIGSEDAQNAITLKGISIDYDIETSSEKVSFEKWSYGSYASGTAVDLEIVKTGVTPSLVGNEEFKVGLEGVKFDLYRYVGEENDDISKMNVGKKEIFKTNDEGKIQLKGLRPGKYRLDEVEAPLAYKPLEKPIYFKLTYNKETQSTQLAILKNKTYVEKEAAALEVVNEREVKELKAQKKWLINDGQPILSEDFSDIYLQLVQEGENKTEYVEGSRQKVESGKQYDINVVWKNLPVYDLAGKEIKYVIQEVDQNGKEISNKGFSHNINENIIENKINDEKFKLVIVKDWADGEVAHVNKNVRPDAIKFKVTAQGESRSKEIGTYTLTAKDNWKLEIDNLYKYDHFGNPIKYTIKEVADDDLSKNYTLAKPQELLPNENNKFELTFTNELINKINVGVKKQWNFEGAPETIADFPVVYFELYRQIPDGKLEKVGVEPIEVTQDSEIQYWNDLEQYDLKTGYEYEYLVKETDKDGNELYGFNTEQILEENIITVTNTWNDETVNLSFNKTWNDLDNKYYTRPDQITFEIVNKATEELIKEVTVSKANYEGKIVVTELPKYDKYGQEIEYIVKEQAVLGYETVQDEKTLDFENKLILEGDQITERTVKKTWDDQNDNDGIRPKKVRVYLTMKNEKGDFVRVDNGVILEGPEWQHTFKKLPKYAQGQEIEYGIEEEIVEGYELVSESNNFELVNKHEIETISLNIQKEWIDGENEFNTRPEAIVVQVLANGTVLDDYSEIILDESNDWSLIIDNLPKYYEQGKEIEYEVVELDSGYYALETEKTSSNNEIEFILRNTELISITVEKEWDDHNNQDGKRPNEIIVHLYNDETLLETVTLSKETQWQYTFTDLPRFNGSNLVQYKVIEEHVDDYIASTVWSNEGQNVKITNKYNTEKVSVSFTKVWEDANNQDGMRPETITVELLANGKVIAEKTIDEKDQWQGSFDNLDKYQEGKVAELVNYTVREKSVAAYKTSIKAIDDYNYVVTNTYETEKVSVSFTKEWEDANNQDGMRPETITVELLANGKVIAEKTISEKDQWQGSFDNLDKYEAGKVGSEIVYEINEKEVENYVTKITSLSKYDFVITNQHEIETRDLLVEKVWKDQGNLYQVRPSKIEVTVYADGEQIVVEKLSEDNDWHHTFTNLPVYKDGDLIEYTVEETKVAYYNTKIEGNMDDGFMIINSLDAAVLGTSKEPKPNTKPGSKLPSTGVGNTSLYVAAGAILLGMVLRRKRQK